MSGHQDTAFGPAADTPTSLNGNGSVTSNGEQGTRYNIGDGIALSAAHIFFEYNQKFNQGDRDIVSDSDVLDDFVVSGGYQGKYLNYVQGLSTTVPTSGNGAGTLYSPIRYQTTYERRSSAGMESQFRGIDMVIVKGSKSTVDETYDGLATFLDVSDTVNISSIFSGANYLISSVKPGGSKRDDVVSIKSVSTSTVDGVSYSNLVFTPPAIGGESGGAYLLSGIGGKDFVIGIQSSSAIVTDRSDTPGDETAPYASLNYPTFIDKYGDKNVYTESYSTYLSYDNWSAINSYLASPTGSGHPAQQGDTTTTEPTNLVIGRSTADGQTGAPITGSFRDDIIVGREGDDFLADDPVGASAWGNDQLYGGAGNDTLFVSRGDDLVHGGDISNYVGRLSLEDDGVDTVDYSGITADDPLHGIEVDLLPVATPPATEPKASETFKSDLTAAGDFVHAVFVKDLGRDGATDTLVSIERVMGTSASDTLYIKSLSANLLAGPDGHGGVAQVDLAGNPLSLENGDTLDLTQLDERAKVDLRASATSSFGSGSFISAIADPTRGLLVTSAERVVGSNYDDDITSSGATANELIGGGGNDKINSFGANDVVSGGSDNDTIHLSGSSATVKFAAGDGDDVVQTDEGDYQLALDSLNPGDIMLIAGGTDIYQTRYQTDFNTLTIKIKSTGDQITFIKSSNYANLFEGIRARDGVHLVEYQLDEETLQNSPLDSIKFGDGTVWTASDIWNKIVDYQHNPEVAFDVLQPLNFGEYGLLPANRQVGFARLMADSASGTGRSSTTQGTLSTISRDPISYVDHLNATYFQQDPLPYALGQTFTGSPYDDGFEDGYGNDNLSGGLGNDGYSLSFGDDTITWNEGDGDDIAYGKGTYFGNDTLALGAGIAPSDLQFAVTPDGAGLVISFSNMPGSVTLAGDLAAFVDRGAFGISFHDGTTWTHQDLLNAASSAISAAHRNILGTSDADFLALPQTNFTVQGNGGDDFLAVYGDGSGTINFAKGDGHDELTNYASVRDDTLSLTDILPDEITLTRNGNALVITVTATGDTFTVDDQFTGTTPDVNLGINRIVFADNTVWTRSVIPTTGNDAIVGTDGADVLHGRGGDDQVSGLGSSDSLFGDDGNDTLTGGAGNDTLNGGNGNDTYVFAPSDGQDVISDVRGTGITNVVQFGSGIAPGDIYVYTANSDSDIVLGRLDSTDTVTINAMNSDTTKGVDEVHFADGTVWSYADIMARRTSFTAGNDTITGTSGNETLYGGAGDDTLQGLEGNDVLDGGTGNDTLYGGDGDDVYRFAPGDGQDVVADFTFNSTGTGGVDTIQLAAGILPADVTVSQANNGADLVLNFAGSGDQVTMGSAIVGSQFRIEHVTFADGTDWSYTDLMAKATTPTSGNDIFYGDESSQTLSGGAGDDQLYAGAGDDILIGGTGNDRLGGGAGNDTYVFAQGDGNDIIDDGRNSSTLNAIQFGAGITAQNTFITTSANGLDIVVGFVDSSDTISIRYMKISTGNGVDQIKFADGSSWSYAEIMARRTTFTAGADTITGTSGNETLYGGDGNDTLLGLAGNDSLAGGAGNDALTGGAGNDVLNGGSGTDTAVFAGLQNDYQLTTSGGGLSIADLQPTVSGDDGTDQLIGVETAQFSDQSVSLASPVILDLDGDGVTLATKTAGARFDWNGDGVADRTGWTTGGDGFLALDRDGDGKVSGANELSFVNDKPGARSDLDGLSAFDTDHDGRLSASDDQFAKFGVWVDANGNGIADAGEFRTLSDAGVASIGLGGTPTERSWGWDDNLVLNTGSFQRTDGSNGALADVALNYDASHRNIGADSGSTGGKRGWRWRQFDRPGGVAPIRSLLDGDLGEVMPAWSNRQAALLAEHIAAFAPAGAGVFSDQGQLDLREDGLALTMMRPDMPVSRFTAL